MAMLLLVANGVACMGRDDAGEVCLFSGMSGVIKLDGMPVMNVRLVRIINYEKEMIDETATDENGRFEFEVKFTKVILDLVTDEFSVKQEIWAYYQDNEYKIWSGVKHKPEENSESRGKALLVECELNSERNYIEVNNSPIISLCMWDVEPDEDMFK